MTRRFIRFINYLLQLNLKNKRKSLRRIKRWLMIANFLPRKSWCSKTSSRRTFKPCKRLDFKILIFRNLLITRTIGRRPSAISQDSLSTMSRSTISKEGHPKRLKSLFIWQIHIMSQASSTLMMAQLKHLFNSTSFKPRSSRPTSCSFLSLLKSDHNEI